MIYSQRVLHDETDISLDVNDFRNGSYNFQYQSGDYLYVGSEVPFNNLWIDLGSINSVACSASVDIWFGNAWVSAVDIMDTTENAASGISLYQDGRIIFTTDRLKGWDIEQDSDEVTGLTGTSIYNMYWARLKWNQNLTSTTNIKYIGQKFSNDSDLFGFYPDLNNSSLMEAFETGKTSWEIQHYIAADNLITELKHRQVIKSRGQVFEWDDWIEASCHKVAQIIYRGLGKAFHEQMKKAEGDFVHACNKGFMRVDKNKDGQLQPEEKALTTHWLTR